MESFGEIGKLSNVLFVIVLVLHLVVMGTLL